MNLQTRYLGLELKNPLVASASPLSRTLDGIRRLESAGSGAIVLYSLFEEQIASSDRPRAASAVLPQQAPGYLPDWDAEPVGPDEYLDLVSLAKRAVGIPVIGSLNGSGAGDWTRYARLIQEAGADALELNLNYVPDDTRLSSETVERRYIDAVCEVRKTVTIPLAVKITPYFTALPSMARQLVEAGANGLVLFNRYYAPDFDIETRSVNVTHLTLSGPEDILVPLRWVALLYGKLNTDIALTGGIHTHTDVLKAVMAGANVAMLASELLQNGVERFTEILSGLTRWLEAHDFASIDEARGILSAQQRHSEPASTERSGYINTIRSIQPEGTGSDRFIS
jgi:dihydroorotate dehydrogenase (fumarate)